MSNASTLADKDRIIENLSKQIASMTSEISILKSQPSSHVEVRGNTQEYEIKIRTLKSRIQELESQLRTQKVSNDEIKKLESQLDNQKLIFDRKIRKYDSSIQELESQLKAKTVEIKNLTRDKDELAKNAKTQNSPNKPSTYGSSGTYGSGSGARSVNIT